MQTVKIDLRNCYGIKALEHTFDFSKRSAYSIYAPNGTMKSSLAHTFMDAALGTDSCDRIFTDRETVRTIVDEAGNEIDAESILVIPSYDQEFAPTEKTSTLLVNSELRRESEQLEAKIEQATDTFIRGIQKTVGTKKDFRPEISRAFTRRNDNFETAILRVESEIERQTEAPFANVKYDVVFNPKIEAALEDASLKKSIQDYVTRYNELLEKSNYFRRGTFDYYNAGQIAKSLADNGFFNAEHTVTLYGAGKEVIVRDQKQLQGIVEDEKQAIMADADLRKTFDEVQKKLFKNAELRSFSAYLQENEAVLSRMDNLEAFREDVVKSYIKENEGSYRDLMDTIHAAEKRRKDIVEEARKQTTEWDSVLKIFNDRFHVPFELVAKNKLPVMLGQETTPLLGFRYRDGADRVEVSRDTLLQVLSMGERKALYIINVIFEIRRRIKDNVETLIIVDDLADSFDYNNKYAIIHYLQEISRNEGAKLIIMTHNFDFFRTVVSRFVGYGGGLMAAKAEDRIDLIQASGIKNVFANDWKVNFFGDNRKKVASIPFLRNIIEMTVGEQDARFGALTAMLHQKEGSENIKVSDLDAIFNSICGTGDVSGNPDDQIIDLILSEAREAAASGDALRLENKVVLAIAIRLAAERYMIDLITDKESITAIKAHQTAALLGLFRKEHGDGHVATATLDKVQLMTPENIHVNAFMYEPIIDMGDDQLRRLFSEVEALGE